MPSRPAAKPAPKSRPTAAKKMLPAQSKGFASGKTIGRIVGKKPAAGRPSQSATVLPSDRGTGAARTSPIPQHFIGRVPFGQGASSGRNVVVRGQPPRTVTARGRGGKQSATVTGTVSRLGGGRRSR